MRKLRVYVFGSLVALVAMGAIALPLYTLPILKVQVSVGLMRQIESDLKSAPPGSVTSRQQFATDAAGIAASGLHGYVRRAYLDPTNERPYLVVLDARGYEIIAPGSYAARALAPFGARATDRHLRLRNGVVSTF